MTPDQNSLVFFFFEKPSKDDIINTENTEISTK
jgi:hypothetical protein